MPVLFHFKLFCIYWFAQKKRHMKARADQERPGNSTRCHRLQPSEPAWTYKVKPKHFVHVSLSDFQTLTLAPRSNRFLPTGLEGLAGRRGGEEGARRLMFEKVSRCWHGFERSGASIYLPTPTMESLELSLFSSNSVLSSSPKYMLDCNYNVAS